MGNLAADANESLENGHGPATPSGDNLMLEFVRGESAAYRSLAESKGGRTIDDDAVGFHASDMALPTPFGNTAHITRPLTETSAPEVVGRMHEFFGSEHGGPFLFFSPWPTPDLRELGLDLVGHPPLMFRPAGGTAPEAPDLRIVAVTTDDLLADFERTLMEAYPIAEMLPARRGAYLDPALIDSRWRFFVGYHHEEPVATASVFVTDHIAMVELVSTRTESRGRGFGEAITAAATLAVPERPAMLLASDLGRRVYERIGYRSLLRYTLWIGTR